MKEIKVFIAIIYTIFGGVIIGGVWFFIHKLIDCLLHAWYTNPLGLLILGIGIIFGIFSIISMRAEAKKYK